MHIGRHWPSIYRLPGATTIEDECPCPVEPCGHVAHDKIDPDCPQHALDAMKTMRSRHSPEECPGAPESDDLNRPRGGVAPELEQAADEGAGA